MPYCPTCNKDYETGKRFCRHCGDALVDRPETQQQSEVRLAAFVQGLSGDGHSDGSFDAVEYPAMPLSQALQILERLPIPPQVQDPGEYCPPALGFGERNISRTEDGRYFLWPEDRSCSFEEARQIVLQIYGQA